MISPLARVVRDEIPALALITDPTLRDAVTATWATALLRAGLGSVAQAPQTPALFDRSLLDHVNEVNDNALHLFELARERFHLDPDHDVTLGVSVLHDVDKVLLYRARPVVHGEVLRAGRSHREHGHLGAALAAEHGVPREITELVRVHSPIYGEGLPGTAEGTIVHYADVVAGDLAAVAFGLTPFHRMTRSRTDGRNAGGPTGTSRVDR